MPDEKELLLDAMGDPGQNYYSEYTKDEIAMLCDAATQRGLKISGGSDYHGTGKKHLHLGMLNKEDMIIGEEKLTILKLMTYK